MPAQEKQRASNTRRKKTTASSKNAAVSSPQGVHKGKGAAGGGGAAPADGAGAEGSEAGSGAAAATRGSAASVVPARGGPAPLIDVVVGVLVEEGLVDRLPSSLRSLPVGPGDRSTRVVLVHGSALVPLPA